jgi:hypothetical protein
MVNVIKNLLADAFDQVSIDEYKIEDCKLQIKDYRLQIDDLGCVFVSSNFQFSNL